LDNFCFRRVRFTINELHARVRESTRETFLVRTARAGVELRVWTVEIDMLSVTKYM